MKGLSKVFFSLLFIFCLFVIIRFIPTYNHNTKYEDILLNPDSTYAKVNHIKSTSKSHYVYYSFVKNDKLFKDESYKHYYNQDNYYKVYFLKNDPAISVVEMEYCSFSYITDILLPGIQVGIIFFIVILIGYKLKKIENKR
jgi:hypothetical protein